MRGCNTLFKDIVTIEPAEKQRRGRSLNFDKDRNDCLINAYYYFAANTGFRYELCIKIISKQFWLSEVTVGNILSLNHHLLVKVREAKPDRAELKKKWPHLNWELPSLKDYI